MQVYLRFLLGPFLALDFIGCSLKSIHLYPILNQHGRLTAYPAQVGIDDRWSRPQIILEKGEKGIQKGRRSRDGSGKDITKAGGYQAWIEQI